MSLRRRWLVRLLHEAVAQTPARHGASADAPSSSKAAGPAGPAHARRVGLAALSARGLSFGAPILRRGQVLNENTRELLPIVRVIAVLADVVDVVCAALDADDPNRTDKSGHRERVLAAALALLYTNDDVARAVFEPHSSSKSDAALQEVERALAQRHYLQGDPILGLFVSHALTATDARALVLCAVAIAGRGPSAVQAAAVQEQAALERTAHVAAIARLSAHRTEIDPELVAVTTSWQVKHFGLPRAETDRLLEVTRRPPDMSRLALLIPSEARGRVLLHTTLAAAIDGYTSPEERAFLRALSSSLSLSPRAAQRISHRARAFAKDHKDAFDPIVRASTFAASNPPLSVRLWHVLAGNVDALWREIKETGDLAVLLARRAKGPLDADETQRMREQLKDVARAVPSLAILTLPGGFVLVPLLVKLLPFDLRPSSWRSTEFQPFAPGSPRQLEAHSGTNGRDDDDDAPRAAHNPQEQP